MAYTAKTAEAIQAQATTEYQSYYDQLKLAAQQQTGTQDLLYQQQKSGLGTTYGTQVTASQKEYANTYSQAARETLSRGMQRSTYNNQTLANVNTKAAEAKQTIYNAQAAAESNIEAQRTSLASQLAAQIMQYDASQAADIQKRIAEIGTEEYQKTQDDIANTLAQTQLEEQMRQFNVDQSAQTVQDQIANALNQAQLDEQTRQFNAAQASQTAQEQIENALAQAQLDEEARQFNVTQSNKTSSKSSSGTKKTTAAATATTGSSVFTTNQLTSLLNKVNTPAKATTTTTKATTTKSLAADIKKAGSVTSFARSNLFGK